MMKRVWNAFYVIRKCFFFIFSTTIAVTTTATSILLLSFFVYPATFLESMRDSNSSRSH